jgi:WD40 repeat protein
VGTEQGLVLAVNVRRKVGGAATAAAAPGGASSSVAPTTTSSSSSAAAAAAAAGPIGAITVQGDMASGGPGTGKHHGPIYRVQRNPSLPAVYLTAGDWSVRLWTEKIRGPVIVTPYAPAYITAAAWSPTRPGVFFAARSDGVLDVWDLAYR